MELSLAYAVIGIVNFLTTCLFSAALIILFRLTGHGAQWALWGLMPVSALVLSPIIMALVGSQSSQLGFMTSEVIIVLIPVITGLISLSGFFVLTWRIWAGYGVLKPTR